MTVTTPSLVLDFVRSAATRLRVRAVFVAIVLAGLAPGALLAQESPSDPVDYFHTLLAQGSSVDQARDRTTHFFGPAVGTEIAVYICSPEAEQYCPGSKVYRAWGYFQELIEKYEYPVDVAVEYMLEHYDPYLVDSIAISWCSPEPLFGCAGSAYDGAWATYVNRVSIDGNPAAAVGAVYRNYPGLAEHIGAFVCAEPTCFAADIALLEEDELAELRSVSPQTNSGRQGSSKYKFANQADNSDSAFRRFLNKIKGRSNPPDPDN